LEERFTRNGDHRWAAAHDCTRPRYLYLTDSGSLTGAELT
jgi:hypothetical protein